jgi:hypothetical protein
VRPVAVAAGTFLNRPKPDTILFVMRLFPATPELRYERMAIAVFVCLLFLAAGAEATTWALGAESWRAAGFTVVAGAFLSMSLAFFCFALIKIPVPKSWTPVLIRVRAVGVALVGIALLFGFAWCAVNLASAFT